MSGYVICRTTAGFGNELFQYSAALAISIEADLKLILDSSYFNYPFTPTHLRHYNSSQLPEVGIHNKTTRNLALYFVGVVTHYKTVARTYNKIISFLHLSGMLPLVVYDNYTLDSALTIKSPRIILRGYWQSYSEIEKHRLKILDAINTAPHREDSELASLIRNSHATALHVRLGDYVSDQSAVSTYARVTADYYQRAVDYIRKNCGRDDCKFFIFSNDITDAKSILGEHPDFIYVSSVNNDIREFKLMSLCENQIIANSTFSWWAAWLNSYAHKKIIVPKRWFTDEARAEDIWIPENWQRIEN